MKSNTAAESYGLTAVLAERSLERMAALLPNTEYNSVAVDEFYGFDAEGVAAWAADATEHGVLIGRFCFHADEVSDEIVKRLFQLRWTLGMDHDDVSAELSARGLR